MLNSIKTFMKAEDGAVTVDWVVLTAAVCGMAVVTVVAILSGTDNVGTDVGNWLTAREVGE